MAWETRKRGGLYYTRSRRQAGRVVREYVGIGQAADAADAADAMERLRIARARDELRQVLEGEVALLQLCEWADMLARAALLATGYHQHHRGEWRRRRGRTKHMEQNNAVTDFSEEEFAVVLERANARDQAALSELRRRLQADPTLSVRFGTMEEIVRRNLIDALMSRQQGLSELLLRQAEMVARAMTEPDLPMVERVLIARLVTCWLWAGCMDAASAGWTRHHAPDDRFRRAQDSANRRLMDAAKTLAQVRRLALPVLQVNVAQQQVNVAGQVNTVPHAETDAEET